MDIYRSLFKALSGLAQNLHFFDTFFVYGHMAIGDYLRKVGDRPSDQFFTVMRDPVDQAVSMANFTVTKLLEDRDERANLDTHTWLRLLELDEMPRNPSKDFLRSLALKALKHPQITKANRICTLLGEGEERIGNYESAIRNIILNDVEVTTIEHYNSWLSTAWNVNSRTRHNEVAPIPQQGRGTHIREGIS